MAPRSGKTRSVNTASLIGPHSETLSSLHKLPVIRNVLQHVLFLHKPPAVNLREACTQAYRAVLPLWLKGGFTNPASMIGKTYAVDKLMKVHREWVELKKSMSRPATQRRANFIASLDELYDLGAAGAENHLLEEDALFYKSMQEDRKAYMLDVDRKWVKTEKNKLKRLQGQSNLRRRSDEDTKKLFETAALSDDGQVNDPATNDKDPDYTYKTSRSGRRTRIKVLTEGVTAALDRAQASDRMSAHIVKQTTKAALNATASKLGLDSSANYQVVCSKTSVRNNRRTNRKTVVSKIENIFADHPGPFLVHWDGKMLGDGKGGKGKKYNRLPVVLSGDNVEQLLGAPRLDGSTGRAEANATFTLVHDWNAIDRTVGGVFDTTMSNTGWIKGCFTLLQQLFKKEILAIACRHHVFELILAAAYTDLLGESNDPYLPFFSKLRDSWEKINKTRFRTAASTRKIKLIPNSDEILIFLNQQLKVHQPRGDYRELAELCIIFLGGVVPRAPVYSFKAPGAVSKARWIMPAIYTLKTWMLGRQLKLSSEDDGNLFKLAVFICVAYARAWFEAPLAPQAPHNDLQFLKLLYINKGLGSHWQAALTKFAKHLWYLSPKLVCFSLFDERVSAQQKRKLVAAMRGKEGNGDPSIRAVVQLDDSILDLELHDFVSQDSLKFFEATRISHSFLQKDPDGWETDTDFQEGRRIVSHFRVVNDCAERAVKLITQYLMGNQLTEDEEQRQLLLLTVAEDRKTHDLTNI